MPSEPITESRQCIVLAILAMLACAGMVCDLVTMILRQKERLGHDRVCAGRRYWY
ncbi:MAG: hypothetical protein P8M32_03770 [Phycisphaerales bacterium]|nr:hypothetical protein [Phycisphaerales bacterium]